MRLREEGDVCVGELFVVPRPVDDLPERVARLTEDVRAIDFRLYDVVVIPLPTLAREPRFEHAHAVTGAH